MHKAGLLVIVCFLSFFPVAFCLGESLDIIDRIVLSTENAPRAGKEVWGLWVGGIHLEGDTTFVTCNFGISARFSREGSWARIVDCEPLGDNWWEDYEKANKENALFSPRSFWRIPGKDELFAFDDWVDCVYTIKLRDPHNASARIWKRLDEKSSTYTVSICDDFILYGIDSDFHDTILAVSRIDLSDYHGLFERPPALKRKLDSVGADAYCFPAFNPIDGTVWLAFGYYNYVYVIDMNGRLIDSVEITPSDFRLPQPPVSRMKSNAVFQDWLSKCTPVESFCYVSPGYFLLRYHSGWETAGDQSMRLFSTCAWRADRRPVELAVDKRWELVGAEPDGRAIFARQAAESDEIKETILYVTRIKP